LTKNAKDQNCIALFDRFVLFVIVVVNRSGRS